MEKEFDQNMEQEITAPEEIVQEVSEVTEAAPELATEPVIEPVQEVKEVVAEQPAIKVAAPIAEKAKGNKRMLIGTVASSKADKTIVVAVVRQVAHPLYKKYFKRTKKFLAHDEQNLCKVGDKVKVKECRPMSARKRWELVEILERAK